MKISPLFLTAFLSFPDPVRNLVRPWKTVRIRGAFLLLMGKLREQPLHIGPDVESVVNGSLRKRIHRTAHIPALPCVGEESVLPFQLFIKGSRDRRDPHDGHKDGEAEPGRFREIDSCLDGLYFYVPLLLFKIDYILLLLLFVIVVGLIPSISAIVKSITKKPIKVINSED